MPQRRCRDVEWITPARGITRRLTSLCPALLALTGHDLGSMETATIAPSYATSSRVGSSTVLYCTILSRLRYRLYCPYSVGAVGWLDRGRAWIHRAAQAM